MMLLTGLVALAATQLGGIPGGLPANSSNVRFQTICSGDDATGNATGLFTFNEPVGWSNYWRANHRGAAPALEQGFFNNWRIVAIHSGNRPTSGYGLGVLRIDRRIDRATICALETVPPRNARNTNYTTSPWIVLRVERGAFDFALSTQRATGYAGSQVVGGGSTVKVGGATVTFGPGYGYGYGGGCDHCGHRGRQGCHCSGGRGCDCRS